MWQEEDFLKMMQVNSDLYGEEITHITGADDQYLIDYFEHRLIKLFYPYYFTNSRFCETETNGKGDIINEGLIKGGFGLSKKQCIEIGNFIVGRYHYDSLDKSPQLSELATVVVLNFITDGTPLNTTQYQIIHKPRFSAKEGSLERVNILPNDNDTSAPDLEKSKESEYYNKMQSFVEPFALFFYSLFLLAYYFYILPLCKGDILINIVLAILGPLLGVFIVASVYALIILLKIFKKRLNRDKCR